MFKDNIEENKIKEYTFNPVYKNIYLDNNKYHPLFEIDTKDTSIINKLNIKRYICISDNWVIEVQTGIGNFYHKFNGVTYHKSFDEEPINDGSLNLYIKDRKLLI